MNRKFQRTAGLFLTLAFIIQQASVCPQHKALSFAADCSLDAFAAEVNALSLYNDSQDTYTELVYDKHSNTLYCDGVPVGDSYGEIAVENGTLVRKSDALPSRALHRSDSVLLTDCAETEGYNISETEDAITVTNEFQTARLIVKAAGTLDSYGAKASAEGYRNLHIFQYASPADAYAAYQKYQSDDNVEFVQPSHILQLPKPTDASVTNALISNTQTHSYNTWGAKYLGVDEFIEENLNTELLPEVVVAVVDTGINRAQSAFDGRILDDEVNYSNSGNDSANDDFGHGTHCTGTICELTTDNVKILPIKVFDKDGSGSDEQIYLGLMYAIEHNADVVSMSFGGLGVSPLEIEAMSIADEAGLTCVAAAGNNGDDAAYYYPGGIDSCITVAAVTEKLDLAYFSNYGSMIDVAAPGVGILSTVLGENNETEAWDGTSMATPHVAACTALLKSCDKSLSPAKIQGLLQANAMDIGDVGFDEEFGWGLVCMDPFNWCEGVCHTPTFSFESGFYGNTIHVEAECVTDGADIYYTTDGSVPSKENGTLYSEPITIESSTWLRAIAVKTGCEDSILSEAAYTICGKDTENAFQIENGVITKYLGIAAAPVVPSEDADGNPVTAIGPEAFKNNSFLVTLHLPDTVTKIADGAFSGCSALETAELQNIQSIGDSAFAGCEKLEEADCTEKLTTVGAAAFKGCSSLEEMHRNSITKLPDECFMDCKALETLTIPKATVLGDRALLNCTGLKKLECPWNQVTVIGEATLSECTALSGEFKLDALEQLGAEAFSGMVSLNSVLLPESMTKIPAKAFAGCVRLVYLSAPNVTVLGDYALALHKASFDLSADLPFDRITAIGSDAFAGFPLGDGFSTVSFDALTSVPYHAFSEALAGGLTLPNATKISAKSFENGVIGMLDIPAVETIPDDCMFGCQYVLLPDRISELSETVGGNVKFFAAPDTVLPESFAERRMSAPEWIRKSGTARSVEQYGYTELAALAAGNNISYQWYKRGTDDSLQLIADADSYFYTPSTAQTGEFHYVCKAIDANGNEISADYVLTVTSGSMPLYLAEDSPVYLDKTNLQTLSFTSGKNAGYKFQCISSARMVGVLTDEDNHCIGEIDPRTGIVSSQLPQSFPARLHVRQLWTGSTQISVFATDDTLIPISECKADCQAVSYQDTDTAYTPALKVTAPNGTLLTENKDYVIVSQFTQENGTLTIFGIGKYTGYMTVPVQVYPLAKEEAPNLITLSDAKDVQTYVFIPKESGKYYFYATNTERYKGEYEYYLRTGSYGTHRSYNVKVSCTVLDSNEKQLAYNAYNAYTANGFSGTVQLLAGQKYYFECRSQSAAEYNLMIAPAMHDLRKIKVVGGFYGTYNDVTPLTPTVKVTLDGDSLTEGTDYVVVHELNNAPGTASTHVIGIGRYVGTYTQEYNISYNGLHCSEDTIALEEPQTIDLTNSRIATCWFTADSGNPDEKKTLYTIETEKPNEILCSIYKFNAAMNFYSLVLVTNGKDAFSLENGTYCLVFYTKHSDVTLSSAVTVHRPYNLNKAVITTKDAIYTGDPKEPEITVTVDGEELVLGEDFKFRFYDEHAANGTTSFMIVPVNSYTAYDSCMGTFDIVVDLPKDAPLLTLGEHETAVTLENRLAIYRICPEEDMRCLIASTDVMDTVMRIFDADENLITVCHGNGTQSLTFDAKAGETYYFMIKFNGFDREGVLHFDFRNDFRLLEDCEIESNPIFWTDEETAPDVTFTYDGETLTEGVDYQLRYCYDNVNIGTATANFIGLGDYFGTVDVHYDIIADDLFGLEDLTIFPMLHQKKYTGAEEETDCDYLVYSYTSGLDTKLSLRIFDLYCRMTLQIYDENGDFIQSGEFTSTGEIPFSLSAGKTVYILMSASDINSTNQTYSMYIADTSGKVFQNVHDIEHGVTYRTCPALQYAEVYSLDTEETNEATILPTVSGYPVTFVPEAAFSKLPVPYTVYGYNGCTASDYSADYGFAYLNLDASEEPTDTPLTGDFNRDGKVSMADAVMLSYLTGEAKQFPQDSICWDGADVNGDGMVNLFDLQLFLQQFQTEPAETEE